MNFVIELPKVRPGHDAIWVLVDRFTKFSYFLVIKMIDPLDKITKMYIRKIVRLHGMPVSVVSNRFTSRF